MTSNTDTGGDKANSPPMDAGDHPETAAGTSHGAGDAETELVPPATAAAAEHAWSWEEPETEALSRPWRSVWAISGIGLLCAVFVAFGIFGVVALVKEDHRAPQTIPTTPTLSASAPTPRSPAPPQAARPDDDEFVALAISPHGIGTSHLAGFGTSGIQDDANRIALSECRAGTGNDDCLLVNAGMFHGCVSFAINISQRNWASGSGVDSDAARANAANAMTRLGTPPSYVFVQCSDPPGIIKSGSDAAVPTSPSTTVTVQAAPPPSTVVITVPDATVADQNFLNKLRADGWLITNSQIMLNNAHAVCSRFKSGERSEQVNDELAAATGWNMTEALNFTSDVLLTYPDC